MLKKLPVLFVCILSLVISFSVSAQNKEAVFDNRKVPTDPNIMFYIQKNTNENTIVYALRLGPNGKIDPKDPMEVFWRRDQEDGRKKKLAWLERTFAFDFKIKPVANKPNTFVFSLVAMKDKKVYVTQDKEGKPNVFMKINGQMAQFERIYVMVDDSKRIQKVLTMELFGRDYKTHKLVYEKLIKD